MSAEYFARKKEESREIFLSVRKPERPYELPADVAGLIKARAEASLLVIRAVVRLLESKEASRG